MQLLYGKKERVRRVLLDGLAAAGGLWWPCVVERGR